MLTVISGFAGTAIPFVAGRDFKCTSTMCYGIGDVHNTFIAFQQRLNTYSRLAGFTSVKVDGFLGAGTVAATVKLARYMAARHPSAVWKAIIAAPSGTNVAANVPLMLDAIHEIIDGVDPPMSPTLPVSPSVAVPPAPTMPVSIQPPQGPPLPATSAGIVATVTEPYAPTPTPTPSEYAPRPADEKKKMIIIFGVAAGLLSLGAVVAWAALRSDEVHAERTIATRRSAPPRKPGWMY